MSDTDDTDVLLLIPPDFFLVHSDSDTTLDENWPEYCSVHCGLVKNLAGEVNQIKNRLNSIETNSEVSSLYHSLEGTITTDQEMSNRHYQFTDAYPNPKYINSAKSTPQKPRNKLIGTSLPSTPSTERENPRKYRKAPNHAGRYDMKDILPHKSHSTQSIQVFYDRDADESSLNTTPEKKENSHVLGEIDQFLSHVKTIKRYVNQRKLENSYPIENQPHSLPITFENSPLKLSDLNGEGDVKTERRKTLDLKEVDKLLQQMEFQQKKMEKQTTLPENRIVEGNETETRTWKPGEAKSSVPDYDLGVRDIMYAKDESRKLSNTIHDYIVSKCKADLDLSELSDSTDNTSPPTVFEKKSEHPIPRVQKYDTHNIPPRQHDPNLPTKPLELQNPPPHQFEPQNVFEYVTQNTPQKLETARNKYEDNSKNVQSNMPFIPRHKKNPVFHYDNEPTNRNLFGLVDLWNYKQKGDIGPNADKNIMSKLEEEKMRRQHCEKLIQDLQLKHLEMQQRLAVAVQVDCAKDAAILRFHEAWEKVADRWQVLETERNQLALKLSNVKGKSDVDIAEAHKKVSHYETEMSKALDLAHTTQDKCSNIESENNTLKKELENLKNEMENLKKLAEQYSIEKKQFQEKIEELNKENTKDKKLITELQKELSASKHKSNTDITGFKNEVKYLLEEKSKLERLVKDSKGNCESLESRNKTLENVIENCKKTEKVLQHEISKLLDQQDKTKLDLRNFYQQQVEILVKDKLKEFQAQLEQTEKSLHDELQNREQTIAKTAAKQLQKLTDKHNLEIQLIEEKHKEEINLYDIQINQLKHLIATQQNKLDQMQMKRNNIAQELKSVMEAQWNEALRIINSGRTPVTTPKEKILESEKYEEFEEMGKKLIAMQQNLRYQQPEQEKLHENGSMNGVLFTTPVSTRPYKDMSSSNTDLQKYIKMLLDKEPGNPTEDDPHSTIFKDTASSHFNVLASYPKPVMTEGGDTDRAYMSREQRTSKPPWK